MVSLSPTSPFANCCAKVSTYCSEKREGLLTAAKTGAFFASTVAAVGSPWPLVAKATVGTTLAFLTLRQIMHIHLPPDKKWVRLAVSIPFSAGMGAIYGQYPSTWTLPLPVIGIMWSLCITYNRKICGAPQHNRYVPLAEGPRTEPALSEVNIVQHLQGNPVGPATSK